MPPMTCWTGISHQSCSIPARQLYNTLQQSPIQLELPPASQPLPSPDLVTPRSSGKWKALLCIVPPTQDPRISLAAQHICSLPSCFLRAYALISSSPAEIRIVYHGFCHQHRRRQCQRSVLSLQDAEAAGSGKSVIPFLSQGTGHVEEWPDSTGSALSQSAFVTNQSKRDKFAISNVGQGSALPRCPANDRENITVPSPEG